MTVDLTLFSLYRHQGQEGAQVPDVAVFQPPRQVWHSRAQVSLLVFLHLRGNLNIPAEEHQALTRQAAERFYSTSGALTTALHAAAERVNRALLERNLAHSGRGQYVIGHLVVAALRQAHLIWIQCGLIHVLALHGEQVRHVYDPHLAGKGLGLAQGVNRFFSQLALESGDRLLITPILPPAWEAAFAVDRGRLPVDRRRKQLLSMVDGETNGLLIQVTPGTNAIRWAEPSMTDATAPETDVSASPSTSAAIPTEPETGVAASPGAPAVIPTEPETGVAASPGAPAAIPTEPETGVAASPGVPAAIPTEPETGVAASPGVPAAIPTEPETGAAASPGVPAALPTGPEAGVAASSASSPAVSGKPEGGDLPPGQEAAQAPFPTNKARQTVPLGSSQDEPAVVEPDAGPNVLVAHWVGLPPPEAASAYAIPPQADAEELVERLASAVMAGELPPFLSSHRPEKEPSLSESTPSSEPSRSPGSSVRRRRETSSRRAHVQRQVARTLLMLLDGWRRGMGAVRHGLGRLLPSLLPLESPDQIVPFSFQAFLSILIPILVATLGVVVYLRFGVNTQYDAYLIQARALHEQAMQERDPVKQRQVWTSVLRRVEQAETYRQTAESQALRQEAQTRLDTLLGITRLRFVPILRVELNAQISRMAASDTDLYLLDAVQGDVLHVAVAGRTYRLDTTFSCKPGVYGNVTVGSLVDLLVLPRRNALNSSVLGVDGTGNLLYCSPGQAPRVMTLPPPLTGWSRVTAVALDGGRLYVLDAPARAVWIYVDQGGVYLDPPVLFFGTQVPEIRDAIGIGVTGDDLYLLHADGRLTHCTYSRLEGVPTRCVSPAPLINRFPAYGDQNIFSQAHFTQLVLSGPPDSVLLLLDADGQAVYRLSTPGFELQGVWRAGVGDLPAGPLGALAFGPDRRIYLAHGGQVYVNVQAP